MAWRPVIAIALVLCLLDFGSPRRAHAEMISTDAIASGTVRDHLMGRANRRGSSSNRARGRRTTIGADGGSGLAIFLLVLMGIALLVHIVAVLMQ
jgi:hypothetical protein